MLQAFIIVAREGLESFLIVAVLLAYLKKIGRSNLTPAVTAGIVVSLIASVGLVFVLESVSNFALLEGYLGVITAAFVLSLVIHMWRVGPAFKQEMESRLARAAEKPTTTAALAGVFLVTAFLITREGMETALMLYQVRNEQFILGGLIGLAAAALVSYLWVRHSHKINLRRFFQFTGVYLIVFMVQVLFGAFHEFTEAGVVPNGDYWHRVTEPYAADGMYGKWFSFAFVIAMSVWVAIAASSDKPAPMVSRKPNFEPQENLAGKS